MNCPDHPDEPGCPESCVLGYASEKQSRRSRVHDNTIGDRLIADISNPDWVARAKEAIARLELIRDCFLEGKDAEAVKLMREIQDGPIKIHRDQFRRDG